MSDRDGELTDRLAAVAERTAALVPPADSELARALAARYFAHVPADDLREREPEQLARTVVAHFELARLREPGVPAVHVWSPAAADGGPQRASVVDVVTDDMPFLVDSVRMELNRRGTVVSLIAHPQVPVTRDRDGLLVDVGAPGAPVESFLHFEIARLPGPEALAALHRDVLRVLGDIRAAVDDWEAMNDRALELVARLEQDPPPLPKREVAEGRAFLKWLAADHFTFLGYREYDLITEDGVDALRIVEGRGLGILRGPHGGSRPSASFLALPTEARRHARDRDLLLLTKANSRSTVHRPVFLDYVGIRRFDADGNVTGEYRFLGLYTSSAYQESPRTIPVIRRKYEYVLKHAGFTLDSHSGRDLVQTLETYPRDELFQ
ncbi:MAG TPA: NAD-glutamate dehydrogenase, partial [Acidimicrobiia bacterium]|nr:NAD-glutamate dehydrogenase [Acidimicrobiia bacterium]